MLFLYNMERIDLMASEMSFENVNKWTSDVFIYYKQTLFQETLFEDTFWYAAYWLLNTFMLGLYYN